MTMVELLNEIHNHNSCKTFFDSKLQSKVFKIKYSIKKKWNSKSLNLFKKHCIDKLFINIKVHLNMHIHDAITRSKLH